MNLQVMSRRSRQHTMKSTSLARKSTPRLGQVKLGISSADVLVAPMEVARKEWTTLALQPAMKFKMCFRRTMRQAMTNELLPRNATREPGRLKLDIGVPIRPDILLAVDLNGPMNLAHETSHMSWMSPRSCTAAT